MLFARFPSQRLRCVATIVILVCLLLHCIGGFNRAVAQQAEIVIVLPKKTPQVSDGDVQYARSVAKRFNRMLNGIGLTAVTLEEASLSEAQLKSRRLVILPLNPVIATKTASLLKSFVANGGKLFVTYTLPDTVAPLLGLRQTNWLKQEAPGHFASIQLNAPDILDMPVSIRQASWNITVAEPTTLDTKIIGYWHNAKGESTGLPALSIGKAGVFFSHIFLPDDIQRKMQMLAALLGHLVPEFRRTFAKRAIATMTTVGHAKDLEALKQFVQQSSVPEASQALKTGEDLMRQAQHCV